MPKTVAEKMMIRPGMRAYINDIPEGAMVSMDLPTLDCEGQLEGTFDYLHLFATTQADLAKRFPIFADRLTVGGSLWVSWPKGRQRGTDLTLHEVVVIGYSYGLVESSCISVDATWSALRFTHPKPGQEYRNSHADLNRRSEV